MALLLQTCDSASQANTSEGFIWALYSMGFSDANRDGYRTATLNLPALLTHKKKKGRTNKDGKGEGKDEEEEGKRAQKEYEDFRFEDEMMMCALRAMRGNRCTFALKLLSELIEKKKKEGRSDGEILELLCKRATCYTVSGLTLSL